ncbi:MAG: hypothetical protein ABR540_11005 [Acidimicrobiales bacterium]
MRCKKRWALCGGALAALMLMASAAWACVPEPDFKRLTLIPKEAKPGQQITASAPVTENRNPIEVRLNTPDGPVVGIIGTDQGAVDGAFQGVLTIPATAQPGQAALYASQEGATNWDATALAILGPSTGVAPKVLQSEGAKPPRDTSVERILAGLVAGLLVALAAMVALVGRGDATAATAREGVLRRLHPTALVLLAGAAGYAAIRPRLNASLVVIGLVALVAGLLGRRRGRTHFIPIALVVGCWGLAVWLVSQDVIPRDRSSAATVTALGLGLLLSTKLARSEKERSAWNYTGSLSAFNAGLSYYVLYDLPGGFARWSAFVLTFAIWAAWEQYRAAAAARGEVAPSAAPADGHAPEAAPELEHTLR